MMVKFIIQSTCKIKLSVELWTGKVSSHNEESSCRKYSLLLYRNNEYAHGEFTQIWGNATCDSTRACVCVRRCVWDCLSRTARSFSITSCSCWWMILCTVLSGPTLRLPCYNLFGSLKTFLGHSSLVLFLYLFKKMSYFV